jgi:hypothetical protein
MQFAYTNNVFINCPFKEILRRYRNFKMELPTLCEKMKLAIDEMIFNDYTHIVFQWLKRNP